MLTKATAVQPSSYQCMHLGGLLSTQKAISSYLLQLPQSEMLRFVESVSFFQKQTSIKNLTVKSVHDSLAEKKCLYCRMPTIRLFVLNIVETLRPKTRYA